MLHCMRLIGWHVYVCLLLFFVDLLTAFLTCHQCALVLSCPPGWGGGWGSGISINVGR